VVIGETIMRNRCEDWNAYGMSKIIDWVRDAKGINESHEWIQLSLVFQSHGKTFPLILLRSWPGRLAGME